MRTRIVLLCVCICMLFSPANRAFAGGTGKTLRVYGKGAAGDWENPIFNRIMPDVAVSGSDNLGVPNAEDLITVLLTDEAYDIYAITASNCNFRDIQRKGFAADMSGEPEIADATAKMFRFIRDLISVDGKILAIPVSVGCTYWGYDPEVWEIVRQEYHSGLPDDYQSLLAFFRWWVEEGRADFPNIGLLRTDEDTKYVVAKVLAEQILDNDWYYRKNTLAGAKETEMIFRQLENLDSEALNFQGILEEGSDDLFLFDPFCEWTSLEEDDGDTYRPMLLRLGEEGKAFIPADIRIMFVNPGTQMKEEALLYLSAFLSRRDDLAAILMYDTEHAPVMNDRILDEISRLDTRLAQLRQADTDASRQMMEELERQKEILFSRRWVVTEERLSEYRSLTSCFFPRDFCPVYMSNTSKDYFEKMIGDFAHAKTDAIGFTNELCRIEGMMMQEESRGHP